MCFTSSQLKTYFCRTLRLRAEFRILWQPLLNRRTGSQSGHAVAHSRQQWMRAPVSSPPPQPPPRRSLPVFFYPLILCARRCLLTVLICVSLMTNDVEHLFCTYWPFVYPFGGNVCSGPLPVLLIGFLPPYCWIIRVVCIAWVLNLYQTYDSQMFPPTPCVFPFLVLPEA